jgi:hypothetical protein
MSGLPAVWPLTSRPRRALAGHGEGGGPVRTTALCPSPQASAPGKVPGNPETVGDGQGLCGVGAPRPSPYPPALRIGRRLSLRQVELAVPGTDQEAFPFVPVKVVGRLAAVL